MRKHFVCGYGDSSRSAVLGALRCFAQAQLRNAQRFPPHSNAFSTQPAVQQRRVPRVGSATTMTALTDASVQGTYEHERSHGEENVLADVRASSSYGGAVRQTDEASSPTKVAEIAKASVRSRRHPYRGHKQQLFSTETGSETAMPSTEDLVYNSKTRELHLNKRQEELVWQARCEKYRGSLRKIVSTLEAHLSPTEKCHRLLLLHDDLVIKQRLRLRHDTYEEIFHVLAAVATSGSGTSSNRVPNSFSAMTMQDTAVLELQPLLHTQTTPFLNPMWTMYRYMIDSGTSPTPKIIQHLMSVLAQVHICNVDVEARAHSLMMDCDRHKFPPTDYTLQRYCQVCTVNRCLHLAVARITDVRTRYEAMPTAGVYSTLIMGLTANEQHDAAMQVLKSIHSVALTPHLLNAALNAARHSKDPLSAFALYRSVAGSGMPPSIHTVGMLLQILSEIQNPDTRRSVMRVELKFVVGEIMRHRLRCDAKVLNTLLRLFVEVDDKRSFQSLANVMQRRGTRVFYEKYPAHWIPALPRNVIAKPRSGAQEPTKAGKAQPREDAEALV